MPRRKLKVLFVSTEIAPLASVGGLSQVLYFLPRALRKFGVDARIFVPKFIAIDDKKFGLTMLLKGLSVPTGDSRTPELICNVKLYMPGSGLPPVYLLENMEYYEKRANVYGYADDHVRFALLSRGAIEFLRRSDWVPDIVHVNDWHTGYLINDLRTRYAHEKKLRPIASVLSIHNLYQGPFDYMHASSLDFDDGKGELSSFFSERFMKQNSLKRGIIYADIINTVSQRYSREIMRPEYGQGLHDLLKEVRTKVYGILNGIDYEAFNPATDKLIKKNFSLKTIDHRVENKIDLQKEFDLPVAPNIPLLAVAGRLDMQKGLDLLIKVLPFLLDEYAIQFVAIGGGDVGLREQFEKLEKLYPKQVGTHLLPNFTLPRKIYAGADMFVLPSRYEPGGIVVMEAMRYGAVPLVRATGGCADTVEDFDVVTKKGTGFIFNQFESMSLLATIVRALELYKLPKLWRHIVTSAMKKDFSWEHSATQYLDLYERAMTLRKQHLEDKPLEAYQFRY